MVTLDVQRLRTHLIERLGEEPFTIRVGSLTPNRGYGGDWNVHGHSANVNRSYARMCIPSRWLSYRPITTRRECTRSCIIEPSNVDSSSWETRT